MSADSGANHLTAPVLGLLASERLSVLAAAACHAVECGADVSHRTPLAVLAKTAGLSRSTITAATRDLVASRLLTKTAGGYGLGDRWLAVLPRGSRAHVTAARASKPRRPVRETRTSVRETNNFVPSRTTPLGVVPITRAGARPAERPANYASAQLCHNDCGRPVTLNMRGQPNEFCKTCWAVLRQSASASEVAAIKKETRQPAQPTDHQPSKTPPTAEELAHAKTHLANARQALRKPKQ